MASFRGDLALAAARTRILAERVPDERDELIGAWAGVLDEIETASTAKEAEAALLSYRQGVEERLRR